RGVGPLVFGGRAVIGDDPEDVALVPRRERIPHDALGRVDGPNLPELLLPAHRGAGMLHGERRPLRARGPSLVVARLESDEAVLRLAEPVVSERARHRQSELYVAGFGGGGGGSSFASHTDEN